MKNIIENKKLFPNRTTRNTEKNIKEQNCSLTEDLDVNFRRFLLRTNSFRFLREQFY